MKRVAVHFNFKSRKLSVREIRPNGTLGKLLKLCDEISLQDCVFTVDEKRLSRWRNGNRHARQFAEVRGYITPETAPVDYTCDVSFRPRERADFFNPATADSVTQAKYVLIRGRQIKAVI